MGNINYVVSYPKSGATWFRFLMYHLLHETMNSSKDVKDFYPEVGVDDEKIAAKLKNGQTFFVKSHYAYSNKLKFHDSIDHIIYLVRDPFNCMKSRLDYYKYNNVKWIHSKVRRLRYRDEFIAEANLSPEETIDKMHGGWNYHVRSWLEEKKQIPVIVIRYEDMIDNCEQVLTNLCQALNLDHKQEKIVNACKASSFNSLKLLEDYEMDNKILGMFYGPHRENTFSKKENVRFVMKGKKRNFYKELSLDHKIQGIKAFKQGLLLGGYQNIVSRLEYLSTLKV